MGALSLWINDLFVYMYLDDSLRRLLIQILNYAAVAPNSREWMRYSIAVFANALYGNEFFRVR